MVTRQTHRHNRAAGLAIAGIQRSAVSFDDTLGRGQPKTAAPVFRREEWLERAIVASMPLVVTAATLCAASTPNALTSFLFLAGLIAPVVMLVIGVALGLASRARSAD